MSTEITITLTFDREHLESIARSYAMLRQEPSLPISTKALRDALAAASPDPSDRDRGLPSAGKACERCNGECMVSPTDVCPKCQGAGEELGSAEESNVILADGFRALRERVRQLEGEKADQLEQAACEFDSIAWDCDNMAAEHADDGATTEWHRGQADAYRDAAEKLRTDAAPTSSQEGTEG